MYVEGGGGGGGAGAGIEKRRSARRVRFTCRKSSKVFVFVFSTFLFSLDFAADIAEPGSRWYSCKPCTTHVAGDGAHGIIRTAQHQLVVGQRMPFVAYRACGMRCAGTVPPRAHGLAATPATDAEEEGRRLTLVRLLRVDYSQMFAESRCVYHALLGLTKFRVQEVQLLVRPSKGNRVA